LRETLLFLAVAVGLLFQKIYNRQAGCVVAILYLSISNRSTGNLSTWDAKGIFHLSLFRNFQ
jgi:hypothetical protein